MSRKLDLCQTFIGQDWWQSMNYPKQILNQKFATVLCHKDLSNSDIHEYKGFKIRPRMPASVKASGISEVKIDEDGFQVSLDLDDFEPQELKVCTLGRFVEVHGKQEEKRDQYGLVSRELFRQYMVPYNCDINAITASFSADYKLKIKVPKGKKEHEIPDSLVVVPVTEGSAKCVTNLEADKYIEIVYRDLARGGYDQLLVAYGDAKSAEKSQAGMKAKPEGK
ncbi:alpha-crystallin A chain-like [Argiope bruennichi]|uniref:Alpha-crystallin B chain like protein n=1 Tax=Argiope bruennichi TaxID=94029 RepID=A0A8T0E455_ARGBR|nr:alpha-crystallin A chain-like [Argiope bruennichi]KAF8765223.1 Alpha-crystallin B chain like protein [Argiope bruennichi]